MRYRTKGERVFGTEQMHPLLRHGLIGWWTSQQSGLTWVDRSGYSNHGTLTNGPTWTLGQDNKRSAINLDGTNDYVALSQARTAAQFYFGAADPFTVSMWVNPSSTTVGTHGFLAGIRVNLDLGGWFIYWEKANARVLVAYYGYNGGTNPNHERDGTANSVPANRWTHVIFSRDSTNTIGGTKTCINGTNDPGTVVGSGTPADVAFTTQVLSFGMNPLTTNYPLKGQIDNILIWDRALSEAEKALLASPS